MARFHAHKVGLNFELNGNRFIVPVGDEFEVPDRYAYMIEAHGIQAKRGPSPVEGAKLVRAFKEGARRPGPAPAKDEIVTADIAKEELADVMGEDDEVEESDDASPASSADGEDISDADAAERTFQQLEAQGIKIPGKRGRKKAE